MQWFFLYGNEKMNVVNSRSSTEGCYK